MIDDGGEQPDGGIFQWTALLAGLSNEEWREAAALIPQWPARQSLLQHLLQVAGRSATILFCFGDQVLLQYEGVIEWKWSPLHTRVSGERIKGKNEVVDPSHSLSADTLRSVCVKIEALAYKCVHLKLEGQSPSYRQRTEVYEKRLGRLAAAKLITPADERLARELYEVRCQFAHSLKSVDQITYLSLPLGERWGSNGAMRTRELKRYFLTDAFRYSETLLAVFKPIQAQQIDGPMFKEEFLKALATNEERGGP
jgi:hypothetical protein